MKLVLLSIVLFDEPVMVYVKGRTVNGSIPSDL